MEFKKHKVKKGEMLAEMMLAKHYDDLGKITLLGFQFWDGLCSFMLTNDYLSLNQQNCVSKIRENLFNRGEFNDFEIKNASQIIDKLYSENINFTKVKSFSKIVEEKIIDPLQIYHRLKVIDNDTWDKILAIGEQTGRLNHSQISVMKTVINKLQQKEIISHKRLSIMNDALDNIKKLGLKV